MWTGKYGSAGGDDHWPTTFGCPLAATGPRQTTTTAVHNTTGARRVRDCKSGHGKEEEDANGKLMEVVGTR